MTLQEWINFLNDYGLTGIGNLKSYWNIATLQASAANSETITHNLAEQFPQVSTIVWDGTRWINGEGVIEVEFASSSTLVIYNLSVTDLTAGQVKIFLHPSTGCRKMVSTTTLTASGGSANFDHNQGSDAVQATVIVYDGSRWINGEGIVEIEHVSGNRIKLINLSTTALASGCVTLIVHR